MNSIKDFLASIGVVALLIIGINAAVVALLIININAATAGVQQINKAFDRQESAHDAMIAEHKAYLASDDEDYYVTDPMNGFDEEVYEASRQAETARHANLFISNAYADN
ncbi:hypothetical protein [Psychrobacter aquaticus]|uniref:Uncharacterized protein n=1 Tax=Psychrobacter aquaticus CMS 56 TaxID=1354303 RepID=U4T8C8_9GAMM|nr:hypothetical protein [Psychrobacter aquaticus]ERL54979.1 hypothetical protein M917_2325 [Psychrobacter aquaticus CMS 56]